MVQADQAVPYAGAASDLAGLYRSWQILDLLGMTVEQLPPAWLQILNIARTLLDGNPIPGVTLPAEVTELVSRDADFTWERRTVTIARKSTVLPFQDEPQVRPIESIAEYPRILMNQRMWQFIDSDLFFYKVCTHDVLVKEKDQSNEPLEEDIEDTIEELVKVAKPPRRKRQRVLVLRDTSSSMNDGNKGIFAKAVALAYLIKAYEEGAEIGDRSYANRVHPRLRAKTAAEFAAVAQRILKEGYYGTTNLADALRVTMAEIRKEEVGFDPHARAKTEILLISDCENPVELPPLPPGVTINTLHLEGGREGLMLRDYPDRLREIQGVSKLFVRIDTSALQLPDTARDAWAVLQEMAAAEELSAVLPLEGAEPDPSLRERARIAERLSLLYERLGDQSKEYRALRSRVALGAPRPGLGRVPFLRALWLLIARLAQRLGVLRHAPHPERETAHHLAVGMGRIEIRPKG
jgi:hypothetical protein